MWRILIILLILIHALIHLTGFLKEWKLASVSNLKGISGWEVPTVYLKIFGLCWLFSCLFFSLVAWQFFKHYQYWWLVCFIAIALSQFLIILYWQDAKAGTIVNIIIFLISIAAYGNSNFNKRIDHDAEGIFFSIHKDSTIISESMFSELPVPVKRWLTNCGIAGKEFIYSASLKQKVSMRLKPNSNKWVDGNAVQYITLNEPAFIWKINTSFSPFLPVVACDRYINGKGNMNIRAFGLFNVVNEGGSKIDEGSLQRFLSEICWVPNAAMQKYIRWEPIDSNRAKATMHYQNTSGSVIFTFDINGNLLQCDAERYMGNDRDSKKENWQIKMIYSSRVNGIIIPTVCEVTWKLPTGDFTWYKLTITDIAYNLPVIY